MLWVFVPNDLNPRYLFQVDCDRRLLKRAFDFCLGVHVPLGVDVVRISLIDIVGEMEMLSGVRISPYVVVPVVHRHLICYHVRVPIDR